MKIKHKFLLIAFLITLVIFFLTSKELKEKVFQYFEMREEGEESISTPNFTKTQTGETIERNYSTSLPQEGGRGVGKVESEKEQAAKTITLEITDICSGKLDLFTVSEGATKCLNKKYPYWIILEKNSTHLKTSFYGLNEFEESYELNETTLIFYIFAEDIATVSHEIQSFILEGSQDFSLGQYYVHTVWERDPSGRFIISKMIGILPLKVNSNISSSDWKELKFYLVTSERTYFLGNLFIFVK
ncbi:MAG: hypothetical protein QXG39_03015 [Candidatus Aenigmatarchaeota archaeon]